MRCLYPVTPHIAQSIWTARGYEASVGPLLDAAWPAVDPVALVQDEIELMLQVNGKLRGAFRVAADASREAVERAALSSEAMQTFAPGARPKKVIVVPGRLVNVVV